MYKLQINIDVRDNTYGGGLHFCEEVAIDAEVFLEIAEVLGRFHELAQKIKSTRAAERA
jgi:hypothetical protein